MLGPTRDKGKVSNKAVYLVLGINLDGGKELLGLWIQTEGAKFWLGILTELKNRYTTNAIESLNSCLRKIIKHRRVFSNGKAATKLIYLAVQDIAKKWTMPIQNWKAALNQFAILFKERIPDGA